MSQMNPKSLTINIPADATVFADKKTNVKTMALSFVFPQDYTNGIVSITKLMKFPWQPSQQIESITINFKNNGV